MKDGYSKFSAFGVFILKLLAFLCVARMVTYALGAWVGINVPVIDDIIRFTGVVLKSITFGATEYFAGGLNRV